LQARRDVPVDVTHIVLILVLAQIREIESEAAKERTVIAVKQAVEPADNRPFEPAQNVLRTYL
jgi:hypothetical protein